MMTKPKPTANETKTRIERLPKEEVDFLGYTFGRCFSPQTGRAYLGIGPSKKRVMRIFAPGPDDVSPTNGQDCDATLTAGVKTLTCSLANALFNSSIALTKERQVLGVCRWCSKQDELSSIWYHDCFYSRRAFAAQDGRDKKRHMNSSTFITVNPATGEPIETFPFFTAQETEVALVRAEKSFKSYRKLPVLTRGVALNARHYVAAEQGTAGESNHDGDGEDHFGG